MIIIADAKTHIRNEDEIELGPFPFPPKSEYRWFADVAYKVYVEAHGMFCWSGICRSAFPRKDWPQGEFWIVWSKKYEVPRSERSIRYHRDRDFLGKHAKVINDFLKVEHGSWWIEYTGD